MKKTARLTSMTLRDISEKYTASVGRVYQHG
jgi:hypothetical protein